MILEIKTAHLGFKNWAIDFKFGTLINIMKMYNTTFGFWKFWFFLSFFKNNVFFLGGEGGEG